MEAMVSCMPWLLYLHPLNIKLGGPQGQSVHFEEEKILLHLRGIQVQFLSLLDHDTVIIVSYPCSQHENLNTLILQICVKFSLDSCTNML
jgi:hypothetical protein